MHSTDNDLILTVDDKDQLICYREKIAVHKNNLLHRAFSLFIFNEKHDKILLQQRAENKYHSGNLWTNACCGHFNQQSANLSNEEIVMQRTVQELNIQLQSVKYIATMQYNDKVPSRVKNEIIFENEIDYIYYSTFNENNIIEFNTNEVKDIQWLQLDEIEKMIMQNEMQFTVWFKKAIQMKEIRQLFS